MARRSSWYRTEGMWVSLQLLLRRRSACMAPLMFPAPAFSEALSPPLLPLILQLAAHPHLSASALPLRTRVSLCGAPARALPASLSSRTVPPPRSPRSLRTAPATSSAQSEWGRQHRRGHFPYKAASILLARDSSAAPSPPPPHWM